MQPNVEQLRRINFHHLIALSALQLTHTEAIAAMTALHQESALGSSILRVTVIGFVHIICYSIYRFL